MRTVHHNMHLYELGISAFSLAHPPTKSSTSNMNVVPQLKRAREVPPSPSPSSVVDIMMNSGSPAEQQQQHPLLRQEDMLISCSPQAKRQRSCTHQPFDDMAKTTLLHSAGGSITPDVHHRQQQQQQQQRDAATAGPVTFSMECDGQYEWWKAPAARAPQMSPSRTMSNARSRDPTDNSGVLGCFVCQRFFVPPPDTADTAASASPAVGSLLNYFTTSTKSNRCTTGAAGVGGDGRAKLQKPGTQQQQRLHSPPTTPQVSFSSCKCTFCERNTCQKCMRQCEKCQHAFCSLCSTVTYVPGHDHLEQSLCLDCASMLDLHEAQSEMMEG